MRKRHIRAEAFRYAPTCGSGRGRMDFALHEVGIARTLRLNRSLPIPHFSSVLRKALDPAVGAAPASDELKRRRRAQVELGAASILRNEQLVAR